MNITRLIGASICLFCIAGTAEATQIQFQRDCKIVVTPHSIFGSTDIEYHVSPGTVFAQNGEGDFCGMVSQSTPFGSALVNRCFRVSGSSVVSDSHPSPVSQTDCHPVDASAVAAALAPSPFPIENADPAIPSGPSPSFGCLGHSLDQCRAVLSYWLATRDDEIDSELQRVQKVDVNGKRFLPDRIGPLFSHSGGITKRMAVELEFDATKMVTGVDVNGLPRPPSTAATQEDYDDTGLYEAAQIIFGQECNDTSKLALYRFFENVIKPKIRFEMPKIDASGGEIEETHFAKALDVPYCGHKVNYTDLFGYGTRDVSEDNPKGTFSLISFGACWQQIKQTGCVSSTPYAWRRRTTFTKPHTGNAPPR